MLENIQLAVGEESTYATEIPPEEDGSHIIHVCLYNGDRRIAHPMDTSTWATWRRGRPWSAPSYRPGKHLVTAGSPAISGLPDADAVTL